jgi:class 3 adenylate cyclase
MDPTVETATILFSDIVGSTRMRVALGDATADDLRRRHDRILESVIERHRGTLVKRLGDGIMATFGGSAEAVAAAMQMQREVDREWRRAADDETVSIRVGLSAGDVTMENDDCHGTPVVTAARLCDAADGSQVLCDDLVRGLARGRSDVSFVLVGELELKGLGEPVLAYSVPWVDESSPDTALPGPLRVVDGELPYAGRTAERARLLERWKAARTDGCSVVLLVGDPGIGKSRLMAEVAREVHTEGAQILLGRCDEQVPAPYAPWIEALRTLVAQLEEQLLVDHVARHGGALSRLLPELSTRMPEAPRPTSDDPDTERRLLFEAVTDLLGVASAQAPVLLLLEDAHWADAGSVSLLRHVVSHLDPSVSVLVVVSFRDTDVDRTHALSGALGDLHRSARTERIALHGLDESGILALLEGTAGHELDRDEDLRFVRRLVEETEGNPFFISEVLRHMIESGLLVEENGRWSGTVSVEEGGLPEGVRDVVGQRLSRFSAEVNDVLRVAAVIGREFDLAPLAETVGRSEDDVADDLDVAIAARLVNEVEDQFGRLTFEHALVRQTLLEELSTNKRIRIHRRIAEALDARGNSPLELLAHHYCEAALAGVSERAVEVSLEAAGIAANAFAWDDAIRLLERAREALDAAADPDPAVEGRILCAMANGEHWRGDGDAARRFALEAATIARRIGDPTLLGEAGIEYQGELGMWAQPGDDVGIALLREALDALPDEEIHIRASVAAGMAHALILAPGAAGLAAADEAVTLAEESGDMSALQRALIALAWSAGGSIPAAERIAVGQRAVELARQRGDRSAEGASTYLLARSVLASADVNRALELFRDIDMRGALEDWAITQVSASHAYAQGRFEEAENLSARAHELGAALGDTNDAVRAGHALNAAVDVGDHQAATRWLAAADVTLVGASAPYAALLAASESPQAGAEALTRWARDIDPQLPELFRSATSAMAAGIAFLIGDRCRADACADHLELFAGELIANESWINGAADWFRGLFAAVDGRLDAAVTLVEAGHAMHIDLDLHARTVCSAHDLAAILLRRGEPGDLDRAEGLLAEVGSLGAELGMTPMVEAAAVLRR